MSSLILCPPIFCIGNPSKDKHTHTVLKGMPLRDVFGMVITTPEVLPIPCSFIFMSRDGCAFIEMARCFGIVSWNQYLTPQSFQADQINCFPRGGLGDFATQVAKSSLEQ